jgi:hypothetical protein
MRNSGTSTSAPWETIPGMRNNIMRDTSWGSGQIVIDGTNTTVSNYRGLVEIAGIKYVSLDGGSTSGILVTNSQRIGIRAYDSVAEQAEQALRIFVTRPHAAFQEPERQRSGTGASPHALATDERGRFLRP